MKNEAVAVIPIAIPNLSAKERDYLNACVDDNAVSSIGGFVKRFEAWVAELAGADAGVAVSSGTAGLHAALTAVGVGPGDLVLAPAYSFVATASAIAQAGAEPWFVDIGDPDWCLDPDALARALTEETIEDGNLLRHRGNGRPVRAIAPVHALGCPADMRAVVALAADYGLAVVADAAAALGAERDGRPVGALGADLSTFSFNGNKTFTCGGGGVVVGSGRLIERVRHLSTTARTGDGYDHDARGFNYRMTNLQAAVGCAQLERFEEFLAAKREHHAFYSRRLTQDPHVRAFPIPAGAESACWMTGVWVDPRTFVVDDLIAGLRRRGVEGRPFWRPLHLLKPYADCPRSPCPVAEAVWAGVVVLPSSTHLDEARREEAVAAFRDAAEASRR